MNQVGKCVVVRYLRDRCLKKKSYTGWKGREKQDVVVCSLIIATNNKKKINLHFPILSVARHRVVH